MRFELKTTSQEIRISLFEEDLVGIAVLERRGIDNFYMSAFHVLPPFQNKGYGKKILKKVKSFILENDYFLEVEAIPYFNEPLNTAKLKEIYSSFFTEENFILS